MLQIERVIEYYLALAVKDDQLLVLQVSCIKIPPLNIDLFLEAFLRGDLNKVV